MSVRRIFSGEISSYGEYIQGLEKIGVDYGEAEKARDVLCKEETWRETCRIVKQDGIKLGSVPLVLDTLIRFAAQDGLNKEIYDQLNMMPRLACQVYETQFTERDLMEKEEKNKISGFLRKKSLNKSRSRIDDMDVDTRVVLYGLIVFTRSSLNPLELDMVRVEIRADVTPSYPQSHKLVSSTHYYRLTGLKALLGESRRNIRSLSSRYEEVLIWKDEGRIPPLFVQGSAVTDLKLIEPPRVEKLRLGLADLKGEIADLANTSLSPEQEIQTVLEDNILVRSNWQTQIYSTWSILPDQNQHFIFNLAIFKKGGAFCKCQVRVGFLRDGGDQNPSCFSASLVGLDSKHLDILKILSLRKLRDDFKELDIRLQLPGGRDPEKVPLPQVSTQLAQTQPQSKPDQKSFMSWFSKSKDHQTENQVYLNNLNPVEENLAPRPRLHRQQTLIDPDANLYPEISKESNKVMSSLKVPGDIPHIPLIPERLTEQNYGKEKTNKDPPFEKKSVPSFNPLRRLSSYLEPHEPAGETLPVPTPLLSGNRPQLSRAPSIISTASSDTRRSSIILDMREAISESGKRLSSIVAENQSKALETLLADLHGRGLTNKRLILYLVIGALFCFLLFWFLLLVWEHILLLRDGLTSQLSQLSENQDSQLSQLTRRLENMEQLISELGGQNINNQLDSVLEELKAGMEGNTIKVAVMDKLVEELTGIEIALTTLQAQVRDGLSCGWNPISHLLSSQHNEL